MEIRKGGKNDGRTDYSSTGGSHPRSPLPGTTDNGLLYDASRYPYYFVDTNGNGVADPDETDSFASWTPNLLRAAYNYQWSVKDPGAFAHNGDYIMQVLFDSIEAVGGSTSGLTRPPVAGQ